jgi:hypothetical protein
VKVDRIAEIRHGRVVADFRLRSGDGRVVQVMCLGEPPIDLMVHARSLFILSLCVIIALPCVMVCVGADAAGRQVLSELHYTQLVEALSVLMSLRQHAHFLRWHIRQHPELVTIHS